MCRSWVAPPLLALTHLTPQGSVRRWIWTDMGLVQRDLIGKDSGESWVLFLWPPHRTKWPLTSCLTSLGIGSPYSFSVSLVSPSSLCPQSGFGLLAKFYTLLELLRGKNREQWELLRHCFHDGGKTGFQRSPFLARSSSILTTQRDFSSFLRLGQAATLLGRKVCLFSCISSFSEEEGWTKLNTYLRM